MKPIISPGGGLDTHFISQLLVDKIRRFAACPHPLSPACAKDFFHHLLYRAFDRKEKISVSQRESASKWILYGREFTI